MINFTKDKNGDIVCDNPDDSTRNDYINKTRSKPWSIYLYAIACGINLLAYITRPGDPMDFMGLGWLIIFTMVPVSIICLIHGIVILCRKTHTSGNLKWSIIFLLLTPLWTFCFFLLLGVLTM